MIPLTDDPVLAVTWSADGAWLAAAVATGGGVRPRSGWSGRTVGTPGCWPADRTSTPSWDPGPAAGTGSWSPSRGRSWTSPRVAYLCDPATGDLTPLATGELISVLDLSVDESYVIVKDGPRGQQFCVVVDRVGDEDHPLLPYPALGSTERAIIRPAPDGNGLVAYLATDAGLPRRQLVAIPLGPVGWRGDSGRPRAARGRRAGGSRRRRRRPPAAAGLEHRRRRQRGRRCWTPGPAPRVRRRTWAGW